MNVNRVLATVAAVLVVLPLVLPLIWTGFHLSLSADSGLVPLLETERPLSVRSLVGQWTLFLALGWLALALWRRKYAFWEPLLILAGSTLALVRLGNVWLTALIFIPALASQLGRLNPRFWMLGVLGVAGLLCTTALTVQARPAPLPLAVLQAVATAPGSGPLLTSTLPWANQLQDALNAPGVLSKTPMQVGADAANSVRHLPTGPSASRGLSKSPMQAGADAANSASYLPDSLGGQRVVLGARAPWALPDDFWHAYQAVIAGRWDWQQQLDTYNVNLLVLDSNGAGVLSRAVRASPTWHVLLDADSVLVADRTAP